MGQTLYMVAAGPPKDVEVLLFSAPEKAIAYAKHVVFAAGADDGLDPADATMSEEEMAIKGVLFYCCYSTGGDCVWVEPIVVDAAEVKGN